MQKVSDTQLTILAPTLPQAAGIIILCGIPQNPSHVQVAAQKFAQKRREADPIRDGEALIEKLRKIFSHSVENVVKGSFYYQRDLNF